MEYQEAIREDLKRLEIEPHVQTYTSDHFDTLYDYAIKIIKLGKAYVDDTELETMRAERMEGINSKNRDMPVDEVLARFEEMKQATERGLKSCLRAKINMQDNNRTLRDPGKPIENCSQFHVVNV